MNGLMSNFIRIAILISVCIGLRTACAQSPRERIESLRDLFQVAANHQMQVRRLDYKRDSLQDIFLKAMGVRHGGL